MLKITHIIWIFFSPNSQSLHEIPADPLFMARYMEFLHADLFRLYPKASRRFNVLTTCDNPWYGYRINQSHQRFLNGELTRLILININGFPGNFPHLDNGLPRVCLHQNSRFRVSLLQTLISLYHLVEKHRTRKSRTK